MATNLAVQQIALTGLAVSLVAADAAGNYWTNNSGKTFFRAKNTTGSPINVIVNSQRNCDQGFDHDITVSIPATTGDIMIGPFDTTRWNDGDGRVQVTYGAGGLTVGVFTI